MSRDMLDKESRLRLAEILGALSLATDLGMLHPPQEAMRVCLLATRLGHRVGVDESDLSDVYYTALLRYLGCNGPAHEEGIAYQGDDVGMRDAGAITDFNDPRDFLAFLFTRLGAGQPTVQRVRAIASTLKGGKRLGSAIENSFCEVASATARRLGLPSGVHQSLFHIFERWDGQGPHGLEGDAIPLPTRLTEVASLALILDRIAGPDSAIAMVVKRGGKSFDPGLVSVFKEQGAELLGEISTEDVWDRILKEEPEPVRWVSEDSLDEAARAFADLTDLKSPYFHGHSSGVALLAEAAARSIGLVEKEIVKLRRAALLHDLGRIAVSNAVWEKPSSLTAAEWEQVRLHAYHTERILTRSEALTSLAQIAGMHHERLDGSGYHRQSSGASIPKVARVLAAADAFHAMTEGRPHRPAIAPKDSAVSISKAAAEGVLDAEAVAAVIEAAGQTSNRVRRQWPSELTDREVDVIRLLAKGMTNKQIANSLVISDQTVRHHTLHIYEKLGVSTRAGAALFAMENDLLSI